MTADKPTIILVHGAFAESASWNGVIQRLQAKSLQVIAAANPLRSVSGDAAYLRDVIAAVGKPVVLVGHSYGGFVITEAAAGNESVIGLVYVCGFAPDHGESAFALAARFPGSTLGPTTANAYPVSTGGNDLAIRQEIFHRIFAPDIPAELHRFMAKRANANGTWEIAGASHALNVSEPDAVVASILEAVRAVSAVEAAASA
jgi:pimeloyl-ACP methyl ester carboxylesterase